jgi:hypothetical protein
MSENYDRLIASFKIIGGILIIATAGFLLLLEYSVVEFNPRTRVLNFTDILSAFGGLILSLFLVVLYEHQAQIAEDQKNVQQTQNKHTAANYRPLIDIESIRPGYHTPWGFSNEFCLTIMNVGNGIAHSPRLHVNLRFSDGKYEPVEQASLMRNKSSRNLITGLSEKNSEGETNETGVPADSNSSDGLSQESTEEQDGSLLEVCDNLTMSIPADGDEHEFTSSVMAGIRNTETKEVITDHIEEIITILFNEGVNNIEIELSLSVLDIHDEKHKGTVLTMPYKSKEDPLGKHPEDFLEIFLSGLVHGFSPSDLDAGRTTIETESPMSEKTGIIRVRMLERSIEAFTSSLAEELDEEMPLNVSEMDSEKLHEAFSNLDRDDS